MNDNKITTKLWNEITETQSENINGGYSYNYVSVNIGGGVGSVQVNGGDGSQINILPTGKAPVYRYGYYGRYY